MNTAKNAWLLFAAFVILAVPMTQARRSAYTATIGPKPYPPSRMMPIGPKPYPPASLLPIGPKPYPPQN